MKYRKKPVEIEAICWEGDVKEVLEFVGDQSVGFDGEKVVISTLEGTMTADMGDWLIRGVAGELYPCKPEIFARTYEPC